jgi:hypothetical protein
MFEPDPTWSGARIHIEWILDTLLHQADGASSWHWMRALELANQARQVLHYHYQQSGRVASLEEMTRVQDLQRLVDAVAEHDARERQNPTWFSGKAWVSPQGWPLVQAELQRLLPLATPLL